MMLVLVLSSLLRPPDIVEAGRRLLSSNDRQSDITRYLVPCPDPVPTQGIQNELGMIVKKKKKCNDVSFNAQLPTPLTLTLQGLDGDYLALMIDSQISPNI